jgi:hypothetical protein
MMTPAKVKPQQNKSVLAWKSYKADYIKLLKRNKNVIQERAEIEAKLEKLKSRLKTHDAALKALNDKYDPSGDLVTEEDKKDWAALIPDRVKLDKNARLKIIKKQLENVADDELVTFPQVKSWLALASKTNGPNDIKVLETQTGIPAGKWEKKDKKQTMTGENLEGYCG